MQLHRTQSAPGSTDDLLADLQAYQRAAVMHALARHDLVQAIAQGHDDCQALAAMKRLHAPSLERLLRAALDMGLVVRNQEGRYGVTERGARLAPDHPDSLYSTIMLSVEQYWPAWRALHLAVTTGQATFAKVHGESPWEWRRLHPEQGNYFDQWQATQSQRVLPHILDALDLQSVDTLVDIAGGHGALLTACSRRWPHLNLVLFEQEHTLSTLPPQLDGGPSVTYVAGDFFQGITVRGDAFLLKSILHDWDDAAAVSILRQCAQAMQTDTRLIIIERVLERDLSPQAHLVDLAMLLVTGGRERRAEEYEALIGAAGLQMVDITPTASDFSLIECRRVAST